MKKRRWWIVLFGFLCVLVAVLLLSPRRFPGRTALIQRLHGEATVSDRVTQYGPVARTRWQPYFERQGIAYPPQALLLVGLKREKQLQVYAERPGQPPELIRSFPVLALSGRLGPKLRMGDYQVPEGFYGIESLNPNSAFHLALRVNSPNAFDCAQAQQDGRTDLGGDIMIHGSHVSVGCLAMGDEAAEDLFVLASDVGPGHIQVILSPVDFRTSTVPEDAKRPAWVKGLYNDIRAALTKLPTQ